MRFWGWRTIPWTGNDVSRGWKAWCLEVSARGPICVRSILLYLYYFRPFWFMCLFAFPRSASEVNPEKREFLRGNAGLVGEILGPFILHWKFKQLTWRIIIEILTWVSPRICPDIFTKEDQRLPIYDVAWLFVVGLACFLFWTFRSQFVICFLEASAYAAGFPCTPYSLLSWAVHGKCFMTRMLANFSVLSSGCGDTDLKLLE